jgi:hypothetical protein
MRRRLLRAVWVLALLLGTVPAAADEEAFEGLRSPLLGDRERAVARLIALLPSSREPVIRALPGASPGERLHLVEVLAADGSQDAVRAVLGLLAQADGPLAARIGVLLARNPSAHASLAALRAAGDPVAKPSPRLRDVEALVLRAAVESLFVSRKSKTGYTGYYRGQYARLAVAEYRSDAIQLCLHLLQDRAMEVPGLHTAGGFEFLAIPREGIDFDEVRGMAANAIVELADGAPEMGRTIAALDAVYRESEARLARLERDGADRQARIEESLLRIDVLLALYLLRPVRYREDMESLLDELRTEYGLLSQQRSLYAQVVLRVGRYEDAVKAYEAVLGHGDRDVNYAHSHYNIACAYASWSLAPGDEDPARLRREAMRNLELAVIKGRWSDVGWMNEDRDLDPIREMPEYKALLERIRRENTPR